jgi:hypothetical protein
MKVYTMGLLFLTIALLFIQCNESQEKKTKIESPKIELPSNSFHSQLRNTNIKYTYVQNSQSHDYSGNWDFDGDGVNDRLQFLGNGGAHLRFRPQIYLSYSDIVIYYNYLFVDMPIVEPSDSLTSSANMLFPQFVVNDFNGDGISDIYININDGHNYIPEELRKIGLTKTQLILSYDKQQKSFIITDYKK